MLIISCTYDSDLFQMSQNWPYWQYKPVKGKAGACPLLAHSRWHGSGTTPLSNTEFFKWNSYAKKIQLIFTPKLQANIIK